MLTIKRKELWKRIKATTGIQSATWKRRTDKRDRGKIIAKKGTRVTLQFIASIPKGGTKNWEPAGGQVFNVRSRKVAVAILNKSGLIQVLKMSETKTNDVRGVCRTIPVVDILYWRSEGKRYKVIE